MRFYNDVGSKFNGGITLDIRSVLPTASTEADLEVISFEATFENGILAFYVENDEGKMYFDGEIIQSDLLDGYFIYPTEEIILIAEQWKVQKQEE